MKWGFDRKTSQSCITKPKLGWFSDISAYICIFNTRNCKKKEHRHCINIGVLWWRRRRDLNPRCTFAHYSLSRGAPSATWVLLHRTGSSMKLCFPEGKLAEREGFEPPVPFGITGFQDQRHQPLGHLSSTQPAKEIIACFAWHVNHFFFYKHFFFCRAAIQKWRSLAGQTWEQIHMFI